MSDTDSTVQEENFFESPNDAMISLKDQTLSSCDSGDQTRKVSGPQHFMTINVDEDGNV